MPSLVTRLVARFAPGLVATAVLHWAAPFAHDVLVADQAQFDALATKLTDPAYVDAQIALWYPKLPESVTVRLWHIHPVTVPIKAAITPTTLVLILRAVSGREASVLAEAHAQLTVAYRAALTATGPKAA